MLSCTGLTSMANRIGTSNHQAMHCIVQALSNIIKFNGTKDEEYMVGDPKSLKRVQEWITKGPAVWKYFVGGVRDLFKKGMVRVSLTVPLFRATRLSLYVFHTHQETIAATLTHAPTINQTSFQTSNPRSCDLLWPYLEISKRLGVASEVTCTSSILAAYIYRTGSLISWQTWTRRRKVWFVVFLDYPILHRTNT